jgi:hypothetical protein
MATAKTDQPIITPLTANVGFSRKVSVRPYEVAEASIFMQTEIDLNDSDTTMANLKQAMMQCKALVFEELFLEFEVTETGLVRELLEAKFGNVTEVTSTAPATAPKAAPVAASASAPAESSSDTPPYASMTKDSNEKALNKKWAIARYATNPEEFYDNTASNAEKIANGAERVGPTFKHKSSGVGFWV